MQNDLKDKIFLTVEDFKNNATVDNFFKEINKNFLSDHYNDIGKEYLQYERDWNSIANKIVGTEGA